MNKEESAYVSGKYKDALEKLNIEITKLQESELNHSPDTKEYQDILVKEIEVMKAKKNLIQVEASQLNSMINPDKE